MAKAQGCQDARLAGRDHAPEEELPYALVIISVHAKQVADLQAAVLGLPLVERRAADPVRAAHIARRSTGLLLPQYPDDLLFREPAWLHVHPPSEVMDYSFLEEIFGLKSLGLNVPPSMLANADVVIEW
jgi:hypothetical protein